MRYALAVATLVVAGLAGAAVAQDSVGDLRVLVIRATWGPTPDNSAALAAAAPFYDRASFGKLRLHLSITPWLATYSGPICPADEVAAKAAASGAGYDVDSYARIVEVLPEEICDFNGVARGNDILLTAPGALVHELGHTFGLQHATAYVCGHGGCRHIDEYGDPLSPMGHGALDFSAYEKLKLGWITSVQRAEGSRTYSVADIDVPSDAPQALVVPTAAGEYWIEHRGDDTRRLIVRLRARTGRTIYIARPLDRYVTAKVFSVTSGFGFKWLDRTRPSAPRVRALDQTLLSWSRSSDAASGVAGYRVTIDGRLLATTTGTQTALPELHKGGHRAAVVAIDRAGNRSRPGVVPLNVS